MTHTATIPADDTDDAARAHTLTPSLVGLGIVIVVIVVIVVIASPWIPQERIATPDGDVSGYVLGEDGDRLIVLLDEPRVVIRVPTTEDREYCSRPIDEGDSPIGRLARWGDPLLQVATHAPGEYPDCPEPR